MRGLGGAAARQGPVPNVTAHPRHPSTASVPITVLLCNGPSLDGFNMPINWLELISFVKKSSLFFPVRALSSCSSCTSKPGFMDDVRI